MLPRHAESIRASAELAGDRQWTTHGRLALAWVRQRTTPEGATDLLAQEAAQALVVFDRLGDELGLGLAHMCMSSVASMAGRLSEAATESQLAAQHLIGAGRTRLAQANTSGVLFGMMRGDHPASLGLVQAQQQVATANGRSLRMNAVMVVAFFAALLGLSDEERQARERAETLGIELATPDDTATLTSLLGEAALACGKGAEAVALFAQTSGVLKAAGEVSILSSVAATQAHALLLTGTTRRLANRSSSPSGPARRTTCLPMVLPAARSPGWTLRTARTPPRCANTWQRPWPH